MIKTLPIAKSEDFVIQELDKEILIYNLRTNKAMCLNSTAALVWDKCDGKSNYHDIIAEFEKKFNQTIDSDFIDLVLEELSKAGLLNEQTRYLESKVSRRKILLRYSLMTIALPTVLNLIAPTSSQAQSSTSCDADPVVVGNCVAQNVVACGPNNSCAVGTTCLSCCCYAR